MKGQIVSQKIDDLDLLRVLAITLVVLRHTFSPFTKDWNVSVYYDYSLPLDFIGQYISTLSMPLFVFISGYIFSYLRNDLKKYSTYKILIKKKIKRLLIPYFLLGPIYIYLFLDFKYYSDFLLNLWKGCGHLWFLLMLFLLFLFYYPFETFFKKNIYKSIVLSLLIFVVALPLYYFRLTPLGDACKYLVFFHIGYLFFNNKNTVLLYIKNKAKYFIISHFLLYVVCFAINISLKNNLHLILINHFKVVILGVLSIFFIHGYFSMIISDAKKKYQKFINAINQNSYYIYILHQPILVTIFNIEFVKLLDPNILIITAFLVTFTFSLLLSNLVMKHKIGRFIIGA